MLHTIRCIKFGEVLLDENRRPFLLCTNCHTDYGDLKQFRRHLESCHGLEHLFHSNATLAFDSEKGNQLIGSSFDKVKEYLIYDFNDVNKIEYSENCSKSTAEETYMDMIKIEEELLDPRWYTDLTDIKTPVEVVSAKKSLKYEELVEAVTPFVQFKENLKSNNERNAKKSPTKLPIESKAIHMRVRNTTVASNDNAILTKTTPNQDAQVFDIIMKQKSPNAPVKTYMRKLQTLDSRIVAEKQVLPTRKEPQSEPPAKKLKANGAPDPLLPVSIKPNNIERKANILESRSSSVIFKTPQIPQFVPTTSKASNQQKLMQIDNQLLIQKPKQNVQIELKKSMQKPQHPKVQQRHTKQPEEKQEVILSLASVSRTTNNVGTKVVPPAATTVAPTLLPASAITDTKRATTSPVNEEQTKKILNKLQTLGLQVKRTNGKPPPSKITESTQTMELLKKLQSKGMNIKVINNASKSHVKTGVEVPELSLNGGVVIKKC